MSALAVPDPRIPESGGADPVAEARAGLRAAFTARTKAVKAVEAAKAASGRARALVAELGAEANRLEAEDRSIAEARAGEIRQAMVAGKQPRLTASSKVPALAEALAEARNRLAAARLAEAQLIEAEAKADFARAAAEGAIAEAIKSVVRAAADEMAERVLDMRAEVEQLQEQIGPHGYGFLLRYLDVRSGDPLSEAMAGVIWETQGQPWQRSAAYAAKWKAWSEALAQNPDAKLTLD
jgi:hypothetical protein